MSQPFATDPLASVRVSLAAGDREGAGRTCRASRLPEACGALYADDRVVEAYAGLLDRFADGRVAG